MSKLVQRLAVTSPLSQESDTDTKIRAELCRRSRDSYDYEDKSEAKAEAAHGGGEPTKAEPEHDDPHAH